MMIGRMIISLKKAASSQLYTSTVEVPSAFPVFVQDSQPSHPVDSIQLSVLKN